MTIDKDKRLFQVTAEDFKKIPAGPIAYWASNPVLNVFSHPTKIGDITQIKQGFATTDNNFFLRYWFEVIFGECSAHLSPSDAATFSGTWVPYNKGGSYRKWSGNYDYVCRWDHDGQELKRHPSAVLRNLSFQFRRSITWSLTNSASFGARAREQGSLFDTNGMSLFVENNSIYNFILGFLCCPISTALMKIINPTLASQVGDIERLPYLATSCKNVDIINAHVTDCISKAKEDWDSYETSWNFQVSPLIEARQRSQTPGTISGAYLQLRARWQAQSEEIRRLEVENNRIFIEAYGLQGELSPEVPWNEITLTCNPWYRYGKSPSASEDGRWTIDSKDCPIGDTWGVGQQGAVHVSLPDGRIPTSKMPFNQELETRLLQDTIKELLSYVVGCMFGRYSLDAAGLAYAGGEWDASKYTTFPADPDNIIPICDDEYFEDDLTGRFVKFIETVFGAETLEENLNFIANALGGRGSAREIIRRYFRNDFFADHCKMYQKRPIYWLFDSGKKGGFRALIYMHRYQPSTLATLRTDYVHEQQERYRTAIADLAQRVDNASGSEKVKLSKQLAQFREQAEETRIYEEKIHHLADQMISIDLDDGVKHNYAIFQDVLAKIR